MSTQLTPQQISQRRRQKILARAKKQQQSAHSQILSQKQNKQNINVNSIDQTSTSKTQQKQQRVNKKSESQILQNNQSKNNQTSQDPFARLRSMQAKIKKQKMLILMSKILGFVVTILQLWFYFLLKNYQIKLLNRQINKTTWQIIQDKLFSQCNLMFWACMGIIFFVFCMIKLNSANMNNSIKKQQILLGSTSVINLLQKLNKVLEYKVLIKAILGYLCTIVITQLIVNYFIVFFEYESNFYRLPILLNNSAQLNIQQSL